MSPKTQELELGGPVTQHRCRVAWKQGRGHKINIAAMEAEKRQDRRDAKN